MAALLTEPTVEAAARRSGVPVSTLRRWLGKPAFRQRYQRAARVGLDAAIGRIQSLSALAVGAIEAVLTTPESTPAEKLRAAGAVFDLAFRRLDVCEHSDRLDEIERHLRGRPTDGTT